MIKWAKKHSWFEYSYMTSSMASRYGNLDVLKYLLKDNCVFTQQVYYEAAQNGYFDIIKWCYRKNVCEIRESCMEQACGYGDLKIIKWLFEKNFPYYESLCCSTASYHGKLDILKFLIEKKVFSFDIFCYNYAAENGNIEILNYLYNLTVNDLSMPWWSENTVNLACQNNKLDTVKFLVGHGCPISHKTVYTSFKHNNYEILYWLLENKCPIDYNLYIKLKNNYSLKYDEKNINIINSYYIP